MPLPDPKPPSDHAINSLLNLFQREGFYAVQNYATHGNIHRIVEIDAHACVRVQGEEWERVESYFTDYDGEMWPGLLVIFLEGFSRHNSKCAGTDASEKTL